MPITSHSHCPHLTAWQPLTSFLPLGSCLLGTFHISEIIQCMDYLVWILSLSVMFSRFCGIVVLFMVE